LVADRILSAREAGCVEAVIDTSGILKDAVKSIVARLETEKGFVCMFSITGFIVSWDPSTIVQVETAIANQAKTASTGTVTIRFSSRTRATQLMRYYEHKGHQARVLDDGTSVEVSWPAVSKAE
jgi:hypothetical protein